MEPTRTKGRMSMKSENQLGRALVMMAAVICVVCVAGLLTCTWPWDILELPLKTRLFVGLSAAAAWLVSDIVFLRITRPKDPEEIARAALEEEVSVICEFQKVSPIVQAASSVLIRTGRKVDPARLLDSYRLACAKCRPPHKFFLSVTVVDMLPASDWSLSRRKDRTVVLSHYPHGS